MYGWYEIYLQDVIGEALNGICMKNEFQWLLEIHCVNVYQPFSILKAGALLKILIECAQQPHQFMICESVHTELYYRR